MRRSAASRFSDRFDPSIEYGVSQIFFMLWKSSLQDGNLYGGCPGGNRRVCEAKRRISDDACRRKRPCARILAIYSQETIVPKERLRDVTRRNESEPAWDVKGGLQFLVLSCPGSNRGEDSITQAFDSYLRTTPLRETCVLLPQRIDSGGFIRRHGRTKEASNSKKG